VTAATTRLPQPLAATATVVNDLASRTLVVRLSEDAGGYERLLRRQGHLALGKAQEAGWPTGVPTVWASAPGAYRAAFAVPGDAGTLRFHFAAGNSAYAALVGTPGLSAIAVMDRSSNHIMNVRFHNRRT